MPEQGVLGLDCSNYTTSLALVSQNGQLLDEKRTVLKVRLGQRGLSQSAALFQHVQNIPALLEAMGGNFDLKLLAAVAASIKPRPLQGSYMPVFTVSAGQGRALAAALKVPFYPTTHQEGHLMVGLWSANLAPSSQPFLAVHLSGGTSEVLLVEEKPEGFGISLLGSSLDLHAGQLVDRIGVAMGLPFPAGQALERLSAQGGESVVLPSFVKGYNFSFSGPEAGALRALAAGADRGSVARGVERCLAATLEKVLRRALEEHGLKEILLVGGVAANSYLRERLRHSLEHRAVGARLFFAEPQYSVDNAVGVALLGAKIHLNRIQ